MIHQSDHPPSKRIEQLRMKVTPERFEEAFSP
jgi:hypothetical protein